MKYPKISEYVKANQDVSDNLDMSTEATNAELNEAIIDEFAEFGVKYSKDGRKLLKAPKNFDGTYSIKEGTQIICDRAFIGCKSLRSIVIPDSVTSIGDRAFEGCTSLTNIAIPDSVTSIGDRAFYGCESLRSIAIPDSVTSIGESAFKGCNSLTNIAIPDSVTSIGERAFEGCRSLSNIIIPDSVTSIEEFTFFGCNFPYKLKLELASRFGTGIFGRFFFIP